MKKEQRERKEIRVEPEQWEWGLGSGERGGVMEGDGLGT